MGQEAQIKDFHKQKKFLLKKIIYLLIVGLQMSPMAQKPAFLMNITFFYVKPFLWKDLGGIGSFLQAVGWPENQLKSFDVMFVS